MNPHCLNVSVRVKNGAAVAFISELIDGVFDVLTGIPPQRLAGRDAASGAKGTGGRPLGEDVSNSATGSNALRMEGEEDEEGGLHISHNREWKGVPWPRIKIGAVLTSPETSRSFTISPIGA